MPMNRADYETIAAEIAESEFLADEDRVDFALGLADRLTASNPAFDPVAFVGSVVGRKLTGSEIAELADFSHALHLRVESKRRRMERAAAP